MSHRRRSPWWSRAAVLVAMLSVPACGSSSSHSSTPPTTAATGSTGWDVVALGDSDTTGSGDPTGLGWVGRYARLLERKLGGKVTVTNLAADGKTSDQLLSELQSDAATRKAVAHAPIVLVGIGGADLNAGDANLQAGTCKGRACYTPVLRAFGRHFAAILARVQALRGSSATALRAITLPNGFPGAGTAYPPFVTAEISLYQATTERQIICQAMVSHRGRCVDVVRAFNGSSGTRDAYASGLLNHEDCCYPSAKGQQLIAQLLFKTGLAPLQP
jgi:lysophospholipase L1-like esterase